MSLSQEQINELYSAEVVTQDGEDLGPVMHVYLDDHTGEPSWITVKTGWFGTRQSMVPLDGAQLTQDGKVRVVPSKETVKGAPNVDADAHLSAEEQDELFRYYGDAGIDVSRYGDRGTGPDDRHHAGRHHDDQHHDDQHHDDQHHDEHRHKEDSMANDGKDQDVEREAAVQEVRANPGVLHADDAPGRRPDSEQTDAEILGADDLSDDRMIGDDSERAAPEGETKPGLRRHENPRHSGPQN